MTLNDLDPQIESFSVFCGFRPWRIFYEWTTPMFREIDQDNLRMTFSVLNVDYNSFNSLVLRKTSYGDVKFGDPFQNASILMHLVYWLRSGTAVALFNEQSAKITCFYSAQDTFLAQRRGVYEISTSKLSKAYDSSGPCLLYTSPSPRD